MPGFDAGIYKESIGRSLYLGNFLRHPAVRFFHFDRDFTADRTCSLGMECCGAMVARLVFLLGRSGTRINTTKMVLAGMATSAFFSSALASSSLTPDARRIYSATFWLSGSFAG